MPLSNSEKDDLRDYVKHEITKGHSVNQTVEKLEPFGFKKSTIRHYYKVFSKRREESCQKK